jgi:hypothetical protein
MLEFFIPTVRCSFVSGIFMGESPWGWKSQRCDFYAWSLRRRPVKRDRTCAKSWRLPSTILEYQVVETFVDKIVWHPVGRPRRAALARGVRNRIGCLPSERMEKAAGGDGNRRQQRGPSADAISPAMEAELLQQGSAGQGHDLGRLTPLYQVRSLPAGGGAVLARRGADRRRTQFLPGLVD